MGKQASPPINEAVFLLNEIDPNNLDKVRIEFPRIAQELVLGRWGGEGESNDNLDLDRAHIMLRVLETVIQKVDRELPLIRARMIKAKNHRLWSQITSLVCSSGVLGAIAFDQKVASIVTAVLSLLASIGVIIAENQEQLLRHGDRNIYDAYERASQAAYKAGLMCENLKLLIKHKVGTDELRSAIESANVLCEELGGLIIAMSGSDPNHK